MPIRMTGMAQLPDKIQDALKLARRMSERSLNTYSGNCVGAVAISRSGEQFEGAFVENASYGVTICAEPAAFLAANTAGVRDIVTVMIVGGDPRIEGPGQPCTPCGRCRQFMWEFVCESGHDIELYCADLRLESILLTTLSELLPYAFPLGNF